MKKVWILIGFLVVIVALIWFGFLKHNNFLADSGRVKVVTTLFPFYDFVRIIGGDKVDVSLLLPPGVDAHSFEPTPGDVFKINQADIFIYTGDFMEPWAKDVLNGIDNEKLLVISVSSGTNLIPANFRDFNEPAGAIDPHIWLDFNNDKIIINSIATALAEKDSNNKDFYKNNATAYIKKLSDLDKEYVSVLNKCSSKEIIYGGHYAFGYLAKNYGLKYVAAQGVSPDAEPTAQDLANLVNQINKDGIKYVFYEELSSPKIAETIASETGAKLLLLSAGHNVSKKDLSAGVSFIDIMIKNLVNLKTGLLCRAQ